MVDPAVSNTVPNFGNTDTTGGSEPSAALNAADSNQVALTSFSGTWALSPSTNAPLWFTTNGGSTWTKESTIPPPTGRAVAASGGSCPCDQTVDYARNGTLFGTFLIPTSTGASTFDVVSGDTSDPTSAASWQWNGNPAQLTNNAHPGNVDQPWLLVNRDPTTASQDDAWSAYDDFSVSPTNAQVAVSLNATPPNFTVDNSPGSESNSGTNPGLRLAKDPRNGWMYALWQTTTGATSPHPTTLHINRSTDGGATWTLNGNSGGLALPAGQADDGEYKFGGVNALLGGVHHLAVDPTNGDVYVVYGNDNANNGVGNQLLIRRLTDNGSGGLNVGAAVTVSNAASTALPSVAVASDGTVGVLYDTFDGNSPPPGNFPQFTAHFARSTDHGQTFTDSTLEQFLSPSVNDGTARQRVLGDFQQLKTEGSLFYGVFSGNRAPLNGGTGTSIIDPVYFSTVRSTTTTYTGATSGDYHDMVTLSGTLTDNTSSLGIPNEKLTFTLGAESCTATTDSSGKASCSVTPQDAAGPYTATASFAGDAVHAASSGSASFTLNHEETTTSYTGPTVILANGSGATLTATMVEDGSNDNDGDGGSPAPSPTETVTLSVGSQSCQGTTDTSGNVSCTIPSLTVPLGPETVSAAFAGDAFYSASSDSKTAIVFAFPSRGAFTLGDLTVKAATPTTTVTWWADTWSQLNRLSGGPAPSADKGFAGNVSLPTSTPPAACGGNWTTTGGNSPPPASGVPAYMGTLVTSKVTKSGSTIAGNTVQIVVVKTNPGYSPNPSNHGTGVIVATYC